MNLIIMFAGLILGFVLLIKGADIFVDASVNIAKRLKIPNLVIGLTIVAIGTSAPELVISVSAALRGSNDMVVGNIIGSNLYNLIFILGLCALIRPVAVELKEISKDYWVSVGAAVTLLVLKIVFGQNIPRFGSLIMLVAFIIYITILVRKAFKNRDLTEEPHNGTEPKPLYRSIIFTVIGVALIVTGGQITVDNATNIAYVLGISERIIGLTVLAIGTSMPELVTSLIAFKKGENAMAIGNIIGSNVFNILFILGLSGTIVPLVINDSLLFDLIVLIAGSLVFFVFAFTNRRIIRFEGLSLVTIYAAYMAVVILM